MNSQINTQELGKTKIISSSSNSELEDKKRLLSYLKGNSIPEELILDNIGLFVRRQTLSRILLMDSLYKRIVDKHGVIMEFGVFFGQNLSLFSSLRGIHEPFNYNRKIIGFDTFEGFPEIAEQDGKHEIINEGSYSVSKGYELVLSDILSIHERNSPLSHINKFELIKGDAAKTLSVYLDENPETIISFAYFDFDIYFPTKKCLELIIPHLTKGSILAFDELNCHAFPGETLAYNEILGLNNYVLNRDKDNPYVSWIEF
jgi:hypothetical protein